MAFRKLILSFILLNLFGCSAALVPATDDPKKKMDYAYELISNGRPIPAQDLLYETLAIYEASNNQKGVARTHIAFADLYKSKSYQNMADIFKGNGDYKSYDDSFKHFEIASNTYSQVGEFAWAGLAKTGQVMVAYYALHDTSAACASFNEAKKFSEASQPGPELDNLNKIIVGFKKQEVCD